MIDYAPHPAHAELLAASSVRAISAWVENGWLFFETDERAAGVAIPAPAMHEAYLAAAIDFHECAGLLVFERQGFFGSEARTPVGSLDVPAFAPALAKMRRAAGTKSYGPRREVELTPDSMLVTNRYTLARRALTSGLEATVRMSLDAAELIAKVEADTLLIRRGQHSLAFVADAVAYVFATPKYPMSLHEQSDMLMAALGEPVETKRLEFGRMLKAIEPDRDGKRLLSEQVGPGRPFDADLVAQAFATLAGPTITVRRAPATLCLSDATTTAFVAARTA